MLLHLTGYCMLARGDLFTDSKLCLLAIELKKSVALLMIRWALQRGHTVIPKYLRSERIKENAYVFDFNLNVEQMQILDGQDQGFSCCPDPLEITV
ncbi:MAG: aldo/keto reductase [SAR324 cluster bacterium]|nr:aldo/keto reductase [SAR324 cluster bacterium]